MTSEPTGEFDRADALLAEADENGRLDELDVGGHGHLVTDIEALTSMLDGPRPPPPTAEDKFPFVAAETGMRPEEWIALERRDLLR